MRFISPLLLALSLASPAWAGTWAGWPVPLPVPVAAAPETACRTAVAAAARSAGVPVTLALGIAQVESGRRQADGTVAPWPWSINVEGIDHVYDSKAAVIAAVRSFQAAGARSIDVGCMQVNLMYHPDAFSDLDDGFDPARNAAYAMRFLKQLFATTQNWPAAAARYHSATPELGAGYLRLVEAAMAQPAISAASAVTGPVMAAVAPRPASSPPAAFQVGAIHLASAMPTAFGGSARGRSLADYRAIPVAIVGLR